MGLELLTEIGKDRVDHGGPKSEELALAALDTVPLNESTRILVVPEASPVMVGATTKGEHQTENDQTANNDNFQGREPELEFTKPPDTEVVNGNNDDEENGDKNAWIDFAARNPVLNNE